MKTLGINFAINCYLILMCSVDTDMGYDPFCRILICNVIYMNECAMYGFHMWQSLTNRCQLSDVWVSYTTTKHSNNEPFLGVWSFLNGIHSIFVILCIFFYQAFSPTMLYDIGNVNGVAFMLTAYLLP